MATEMAVIKQEQSELGFTNVSGFELMQRAAKALASSSLVPEAYRNNQANCMIALNMAHRMQADPLMVMQNLYIVYGRPAWSAQFLIACFNKCGRFSSIRFEFFGERGKDTWGCRASAKELSTGEFLTGPDITIEMARKEDWLTKKGSKWQTIPELMLRYRAASWFIRTVAPEIAMGFHTDDEIRDGLGAYDADAEIVETKPEPEEKKSALDAIVDAGTAKKPEVGSQDDAPGGGLSDDDLEFMRQGQEDAK